MAEHGARHAVVLRDFSYEERQGEGGLCIERCLRAPPADIDIHVIPPSFIDAEYIADADLVISFGIKRYPDQSLGGRAGHPRHVHVVQDWWEPQQPQSQWRNQVIESATRVIFTSPLHDERYVRLYQPKRIRSSIVPFPLSANDYAPARVELEGRSAVLWCLPWHPDYGNDIMIRWARQESQDVDAYGLAVPTGEISARVRGCGKIALDAAAPTFRQYDKFIYFPRTPVPFGFTFLLAYLLGLEVSYSGEIGCLSYVSAVDYGWPSSSMSVDDVIDESLGATDRFWEIVEEVVA